MFLIKFYQHSFSYFFGGSCRFYPSCSNYAIECFEKKKPLSAFKMVIVRLSKCHPLSFQSGYDPVINLNEHSN